MKVIILAGGIGKRMDPIKQDKLLLKFLGKPFFEYVLESLSAFDNFIIVASPTNKDSLQEITHKLNLNAEFVIQEAAEGMADAVLKARDLIDGEVMIVNADDLSEPEVFTEVISKAKNSDAEVVLAGKEMEKYFPGGYLKVSGDSAEDIVEKPGEGNEPSKLVRMAVDYFKDGKKLLEYLQNSHSDKDDVYEAALNQMIQEGSKVVVSEYAGSWVSLKYPWHVLQVMKYFLKNISGKRGDNVFVSPKAHVDENVVLENGVKVFDGASIKGPCYIGKNVVVGNNALVRESIVQDHCVIGYSTEIARSYVGENSWFHTNYVGDSILEGDFGMGSGAVLANLRLDGQTVRVGEEKIDSNLEKLGLIAGKGVRVGVNASTMPGVRVGKNSLIGPSVILYKDVEEGKKVLLKQEHSIEENSDSVTSYDQFRGEFEK